MYLLEDQFLALGIASVLFVYIVLGLRIARLFEKLREPLQSPAPGMMMTKLSLAMFKVFKLEIEVDPKTPIERTLIQEIRKTVQVARLILLFGGICFVVYLGIRVIGWVQPN